VSQKLDKSIAGTATDIQELSKKVDSLSLMVNTVRASFGNVAWCGHWLKHVSAAAVQSASVAALSFRLDKTIAMFTTITQVRFLICLMRLGCRINT
jgi:hypothetical protein